MNGTCNYGDSGLFDEGSWRMLSKLLRLLPLCSQTVLTDGNSSISDSYLHFWTTAPSRDESAPCVRLSGLPSHSHIPIQRVISPSIEIARPFWLRWLGLNQSSGRTETLAYHLRWILESLLWEQ